MSYVSGSYVCRVRLSHKSVAGYFVLTAFNFIKCSVVLSECVVRAP